MCFSFKFYIWIKRYFHTTLTVLQDSVYIFTFTRELCIFVCFVLLSFHFNLKDFSNFSKAGLVVMNFLSFCLSEVLFLLHIWRTVLLGVVFSWQFLCFRTLTISSYSLLAYTVSVEKSAGYLMGLPCRWQCACILRFSKLFAFSKFDNVSHREPLWVHLIGVLWASWNWMCISFLRLLSFWSLYLDISSLLHSASLFLGLP